ncbi:hypothetical protein FYJ45_09825 [Eisenbergiella tayi]|uniref:Uncharacterized protein n=1 Tax=Eisenbergiella porci TaxID=2652274 RepID=A0A6N7W209_9FIRM|nr:hypothetical protein [Eisenbergiella porci]
MEMKLKIVEGFLETIFAKVHRNIRSDWYGKNLPLPSGPHPPSPPPQNHKPSPREERFQYKPDIQKYVFHQISGYILPKN